MNYATLLFMAMVMFVLVVTILDMFTVLMCMNLTLTFNTGQGKMQICPSKGHTRLHIFGSSNVCSIYQHFRDIHSQNVHDLDLSL